MAHANDNQRTFYPSIDLAVPGQAITIRQAHRRFGESYAEFVEHAGDGRRVYVRKLISSMWKARWTKPLAVFREDIIAVHGRMARS